MLDVRTLVSLVFATVCACHGKPQNRVETIALPQNPAVAVADRNADLRVERGEYLAAMLGCKYCHVAVGPTGPDLGQPLAGGFEVRETFGTWRSPNITQSKTRGIGAWNDKQIAAAIREGVRPDGTQLYPVMPYLNYNRMTDDDVTALVAYLRTVAPNDNAVAPNDLDLPRTTAPRPSNAPDPVNDPVKHGEYLVTIMNCSMCHTPAGKDGMPDLTKRFAGGVEIEIPALGTGTLIASNITSDPATGIGTWSQVELERAVKKPGVGGARIQGYLTGANEMSDADLAAMVAYLRTIPPITHQVARSTFELKGWMDLATGAGTADLPLTARR